MGGRNAITQPSQIPGPLCVILFRPFNFKTMKSILPLLTAIILFCSCTKTNVNTFNKPCTDSCTTVQGRFITGNNEGIANVPIEINSEIRPPSGLGQTTIRKIASGTTDNSGFYSLKFGLQDKEYGQIATAHLSINFIYDKSKLLPVAWYESFGTNESLGPLSRKDTIITANIFLTSRSKLKIKLENFVPVQPGDVFSVITSCGAGLERHYESGGFIEANQPTVEQEIDACGNEQTTVIARKTKNGISSSTSTTILTPTGQTVAVTFTY